ncbi:MAG: metallophosphoesterase [Pseudomonadota bacterium]
MLKWLRRGAKPELAVPLPHSGDRIYAVGDIHGRSDLFEELLTRLRRDADGQTDERRSILVLLGDYVDRGDHSREVLDQILKEAQSDGPWTQIVALRGNHEAALLDFLEDPEKGAAWLSFGGKQTLASYGVPVAKARPDTKELSDMAQALSRAMGDHVSFLNRTARAYRSGDVVFAHAGVASDVPLSDQSEAAVLWGRSDFLEVGPPPGLRVVHGHWDDYEPVVTEQRLCLDTGAYYSGRLTAARLDSDTELIHVDVFDL